jgi:hypothetical protein
MTQRQIACVSNFIGNRSSAVQFQTVMALTLKEPVSTMEDCRKSRTIRTVLFRLPFKHTRNLKDSRFRQVFTFNSLARVTV